MAQATAIKVLNSKDFAASRGIKRNSCDIIIEEGLFENGRIDQLLLALLNGRATSFVVITDTTVERLYGSTLVRQLSRVAKTDLIKVSPGEQIKTFDTCTKILSDLAKLGFDKDGVLILLGGGVVGDIGGFVAAIYKRGVKYIQVPTTLLAQIDSSIGGKNGVDTEWGKNQVGTIYQPSAVLIDPSFLKTLPAYEILSGIGEMVKYAVTSSRRVFSELEAKENGSISNLTYLIEPCCRIKARIVSRDPYDLNIRSLLNYGHTVGHSLEAASNYSMSHGISVLVGMLAEGWIAHELDIFQSSDFQRQEELIKRLFKIAPIPKFKLSQEKIAKFILSDKKNAGGKLRMSLPERIGKMHLTKEGNFKTPVSFDLLKPSIDYAKSVLSAS
jgi:3-dehydroquinate synthase